MRWNALALICALTAGCGGPTVPNQPPAVSSGAAVLFEGAGLIVGDGSAPIDRAAFVVEGDRITRVGRQGEVALPAGARRVDLAGKTVMPALISTHMHVGLLAGNDFGPQVYTHDNIVDNLQRYAYYGLAAVLSAGTDVGPLSFQVREERPAGAARLLTAGRGMAAPDGGPGIPSIASVSFPITNADEGRARTREVAAQRADALKIWVDDRGGRVKKLLPDIFGPIIEEAHQQKMMAIAHVYYLKDAHQLVEAGIDGFMHLVRDKVMDEGLVNAMKQRGVFVAANIGGQFRPSLTAPPPGSAELLSETVPASIVEFYRQSFANREAKMLATARATADKMCESLRRLNQRGVTITLGGDTGIPNAWHGWAEHLELERMNQCGMTPAQVIVAATSAAARVLNLNDLGTIAAGKSADFLVLDANPLDDILNTRKIASVYQRGQELDRPALQQRWTANRTQ